MAKQRKPPAPAKFKVGDRVRVKHGIRDTDYPDMPLGGWAGTIFAIETTSRPPSTSTAVASTSYQPLRTQ